MLVKPPIYGLDIAFEYRAADHAGQPGGQPGETVTVDPYDSVIVAAGISTIDGDEYYDGSERRILSILDQRFAVLEPGIITTWNGSVLDLPLLRARARALDLGLGLRIHPDRRRPLRIVGRTPAPPQPSLQIGRAANGGARPVAGAWHQQRHLDLRWVYGDEGSTDHDDPRWQDPCRGAHLARALAERRWNRARRHLDRMPPPAQLTSFTWTCLADEADTGPIVDVPLAARLRHPSAGLAIRN